MKIKGRSILNIGTSSLLVIFVILSLITFATLSIVSAKADYELSKTLDQQTTDFNRASNEAEVLLNDVDQRLLGIYNNSTDEADYFSKCQLMFLESENGFTFNPVNRNLAFTKMISNDQALSIVLAINYPKLGSNQFYSVISWQKVNTEQWEPDTSLNLLPIG